LADRARIAFLAEMDHFTAEKSEFRLLCIRYLASRGWRLFGEEVDWRVGQRLDRFLTDGTESMLAPLVEAPWYKTGVLADPTARQNDVRMQLDRARLVRKVRDAVPGARWFGFDVGATDTDYLAAANAAETFEALRPVMARREELIHERVGEFLRDHPGEKVALMAGSTHLAKNDEAIDTPGVVGPGGGMVPSIGHHVVHDLADTGVLSIWFLHGAGRSDNPYLDGTGTLVPAPGTLNAELLQHVGRPCLLRVDDDREWRSITQMHNAVLQCRLAEQVDAIVFAPFVTPLSASS
jgi:hypothetical protein